MPDPSRRSPHKVALLGLGTMGRRHARVLGAAAARYEIVGGYDVSAAARAPEGVTRLRSEAEAIARAEVVVVATPIAAHAAAVERALAAGRHVFVEKPLCARADEAHAIARSARAGARLFVGHSERFNPVVRALARLVRRDPALTIELTRVGPSGACGVGVLLNLGVHDFDLAAYLGGGDVSLRDAPGPSMLRGSWLPREDLAHVLFQTAAGATGSIYVDRTASTRRRTIRLATARWVYEGDLLAHRLTRSAGGRSAEVPLVREEPLAAQAAALADALDAGPAARAREIAGGTDGARAVALAERAGAAACWPAEAENLSLLAGP